jgi:hypothetical protein
MPENLSADHRVETVAGMPPLSMETVVSVVVEVEVEDTVIPMALVELVRQARAAVVEVEEECMTVVEKSIPFPQEALVEDMGHMERMDMAIQALLRMVLMAAPAHQVMVVVVELQVPTLLEVGVEVEEHMVILH